MYFWTTDFIILYLWFNYFRFHFSGPEPTNEEMGAFTSYNRAPTDPQYARVSKISVDSFETSSTSSGECYENVNNGYVAVNPGQSNLFTHYFLILP